MGSLCVGEVGRMLLEILFLLQLLLVLVHGTHVPTVPKEDKIKCHTGVRVHLKRQCNAYRTGTQEELAASGRFPVIEDWCNTIRWREANMDNKWGNCMEMTKDEEFRYITANQVPDYYYNPYCPIGLGYGYCTPQEDCHFPELICGEDNGNGTTEFGDVWVPLEAHFKIPLVGNPTRSDRPGDMYDAATVGAEKEIGHVIGVAINGINIQGPNDAGDVSIDEAGFQLACGGHVTPPTETLPPNPYDPNGPMPSLYHYHKSPECLAPFTNASLGFHHGAQPYTHAQLMGWAMDGFGIYAYQDVNGAAPIVDECGGHFGPVDSGEVVYHYHSRPIVPYHLACQGPSLGQCASTQRGTNFCHPGCGADICIQPGTSEEELRAYLGVWDDSWLDNYTSNEYKEY